MARIKRKHVIITSLSVIALYLSFSLFTEQGADISTRAYPSWVPKQVLPRRMSLGQKQTPFVKPSAYAAAPGFEKALPSCRITDLPEDPLVMEYGQNNIRLSRTYEGSGVKVRRVLQKAIRGEPIRIAVAGGSVSTVGYHSSMTSCDVC
jgi:hypothetical protein